MRKSVIKRGQGTVEFMIIFGFAIFFFILFFGIVQMNAEFKNKENRILALQTVTINVKDEIFLAAEASDGYSRNFFVPENILGQEYNISFNESYVFSDMGGQTFSYKIPEVNGYLKKKENTIRKEGGIVYVN